MTCEEGPLPRKPPRSFHACSRPMNRKGLAPTRQRPGLRQPSAAFRVQRSSKAAEGCRSPKPRGEVTRGSERESKPLCNTSDTFIRIDHPKAGGFSKGEGNARLCCNELPKLPRP